LWTVHPNGMTQESFGQSLTNPIQVGRNYYFKVAATQASFSDGSCANIEVFGLNTLPTLTLPSDNYLGDHPGAVLLGSTDKVTTINEFEEFEVCFTSPGYFNFIAISVSKTSCNSYVYVDDLQLYELDELKLFGDELGLCDRDTISLGVTYSNPNVVWQDGSNDPILKVFEPGQYWVSAKNICGMDVADTVFVRDDRMFLPTDFLPDDTFFCHNEEFFLEVPTPINGVDYQWSTGESTASISPTQDGFYSVIATKNDCIATDQVEVEIYNCKDCQVFAPNAFTPNLDGINDEFLVKYNCDFINYQLLLFDRWGNLVWESKSPDSSWNGKIKSDNVRQGVYAYKINFTVEEFGEIVAKTKTGVVLLLP